jgi:serine/threonine protein kinase
MENKKEEEPDLEKDLIINEKYKVIYKIGKGGFGKVYLVQNLKDGKKYALKVLLQKKKSDKNKRDFQLEIFILKRLHDINSSYVLKLYDEGKFITEEKIERLYFVVDYAEKGDIFNFLKTNGGLGEKYSKIIFKKILEGIQFCHDNNIAHFDIKVANILLDDKFNPIIIDFGICKPIKNLDTDEFFPYKGTRGTKEMMCPQMFEEGIKYNGIDADIFALGVLLFNLVLGKKCFKNVQADCYQSIKNKNYDFFWETVSLEQKENLSKEFKNLFVRMIAYNPEERPRIKDILLKDPWLEPLNTLEEYKKLEEEYIEFMMNLEQKITETNQSQIQAPKETKKETNYSDRGSSMDVDKKYFNNLTPNKVNKKRRYKYCIKINGKINANNFMNLLVNEIIKAYGTDCLVDTNEEKLKFEITFINQDEGEEKEEEDEENNRDCIMKVKLYEDGIDKYLLCFDKCQGDLEVFYENFLKIKDIIKNHFNY